MFPGGEGDTGCITLCSAPAVHPGVYRTTQLSAEQRWGMACCVSPVKSTAGCVQWHLCLETGEPSATSRTQIRGRSSLNGSWRKVQYSSSGPGWDLLWTRLRFDWCLNSTSCRLGTTLRGRGTSARRTFHAMEEPHGSCAGELRWGAALWDGPQRAPCNGCPARVQCCSEAWQKANEEARQKLSLKPWKSKQRPYSLKLLSHVFIFTDWVFGLWMQNLELPVLRLFFYVLDILTPVMFCSMYILFPVRTQCLLSSGFIKEINL